MIGLLDAARFLLLGAVSLTIQAILAREALFAFQGGEIGLGMLFAVWLAAIALGAHWGTAWVRARGEPGPAVKEARDGAGGAEMCAGPARAEARDGAAGAPRAGDDGSRAGALGRAGLILLPWVGVAQVFLFRHHRGLLPIGAGAYLPAWAYALLLVVAAAPAGFLTGFLFPVLLRTSRRAPGEAYGIEALGSMAGGALASLVALPRVPALPLLAAWAFAAAALMSADRRPAAERAGRENRAAPRREGPRRLPVAGVRAAGALFGVAALAWLASGAATGADRSWARARWEGLRTGAAILLSHDTPYHQVTVAERAGEASLFIDGLYQGALDDPYEDDLVAAIVLTQHPAPREVLIVAPALSGPARAISTAAGVRATLVRADERLDLIVGGELDRGGPGAAAERVTADPRAAVRDWGRSAAASFDVIAILQGGAVSGAGNRVSTSEFFSDCARVLRPGGLLAIAIPGAANVASPEGAAARAAVFGALSEVFADVRIAPGTTHQLFAALPRGGPGRSGARGAPAGDSPLTWDPDSLAARHARLRTSAPPWPPRLFAQLLPAERVEHLQRAVTAALAAGVPVNRDRRPIAYFAQIRLWDRLSGSGLSGMLSSWHRRPWAWSGGVLLLLAAGGLLLRRRHGPAAVSLASTGMVGMGADLLILLLYQTAVGTLYLNVGLVVALFMCGLGAGALAGSRWRVRARRAPALVDLAWVALLLAWIPLLGLLPRLSPSAAEAVILALAALSGALTALPFPWVAARLAQREAARGTAAWGAPGLSGPAGGDRARVEAIAGGQADAIDHCGAFFGALLTGTLLVPLLGFTATLGLLAGVKLLSALAWVGSKPGATPRSA